MILGFYHMAMLHAAVSFFALVISIDKSDDNEVEGVAEGFEWGFGEKRIIKHEQHLGLKEHVFRCGALTKEYGNVPSCH